MIKIPAQHQTDTEKAPGQVRLWRPADQTLGDYVTRVQQQEAFEQVAVEKKLTFEEWWQQELDVNLICEDEARWIWQSAQRNK